MSFMPSVIIKNRYENLAEELTSIISIHHITSDPNHNSCLAVLEKDKIGQFYSLLTTRYEIFPACCVFMRYGNFKVHAILIMY